MFYGDIQRNCILLLVFLFCLHLSIICTVNRLVLCCLYQLLLLTIPSLSNFHISNCLPNLGSVVWKAGKVYLMTLGSPLWSSLQIVFKILICSHAMIHSCSQSTYKQDNVQYNDVHIDNPEKIHYNICTRNEH